MNKTIKIYNHFSNLNKILSQFIKLTNKSINLEISINNLNLNVNDEAEFDIDLASVLKIEQDGEVQELELNQFDTDSDLYSMLDDIIFEEIQNHLWSYLSKSLRMNNDILFEDLKIHIEQASSIETLYYKIRTDKIEYPSYAKEYILYKMLSEQKDKVTDISVVEDFIDSSFNIKYADLILSFPSLKQTYKNRFLNHAELNPVVKNEYYLQNDELPNFDLILATNDLTRITNFYFQMKNSNIYEHKSETIIKLLKYKNTTTDVLTDIYQNSDIIFIYQFLLRHNNCPVTLLNHYINVPSYQETILENPQLNEDILNKMINTEIDYQNRDRLMAKVLASPVLANKTKIFLEQKNDFLKSLDSKEIVLSHDFAYWEKIISGEIFNSLKLSIGEQIIALEKIKNFFPREVTSLILKIDNLRKEYQMKVDELFPNSSNLSEELVTHIFTNPQLLNEQSNLIDLALFKKDLKSIPMQDKTVKDLTLIRIKDKIIDNYTLSLDLADFLLNKNKTLWGINPQFNALEKKELILVLSKSEIPENIKEDLLKIAV